MCSYHTRSGNQYGYKYVSPSDRRSLYRTGGYGEELSTGRAIECVTDTKEGKVTVREETTSSCYKRYGAFKEKNEEFFGRPAMDTFGQQPLHRRDVRTLTGDAVARIGVGGTQPQSTSNKKIRHSHPFDECRKQKSPTEIRSTTGLT
jgi:hypothetical protein